MVVALEIAKILAKKKIYIPSKLVYNRAGYLVDISNISQINFEWLISNNYSPAPEESDVLEMLNIKSLNDLK